MATVLKLSLAGALGLVTALLVACGGGGQGLIPGANAGPLKSDFDAVASAVSSGDCTNTRSALSQAKTDLESLPPSVDPRLKRKLAQGLHNLARNAVVACKANQPQTTTTQTTTTTAPPTTTQTTPPTTQTQTTPPSTSTQPPPSTGPGPGSGGGTPAPGGGGGNGGGGNGGGDNGGGGNGGAGAGAGAGGGNNGGTPGQ